MNVRFFLIGLFSLVMLNLLTAQDTTRTLGPWGLSLGVFPHGSSVNSDLLDYNWDVNMSFSGGVCLPVSEKWVLTGDLMLLHTGSVLTRPPLPPNELIKNEDIRDRFAYINLALGGRLYLGQKFYVGAYTGPALHLYTERLTTKNYVSGFEQEERRRVPFGEGDVRTINWFTSLGIGYEIQLGPYLGLGLEPTIYSNLLSIDSKSDFDARAFGIGLRTNIIFKDFNHNVRMSEIPEKNRARFQSQKRKEEREAKRAEGNASIPAQGQG